LKLIGIDFKILLRTNDKILVEHCQVCSICVQGYKPFHEADNFNNRIAIISAQCSTEIPLV